LFDDRLVLAVVDLVLVDDLPRNDRVGEQDVQRGAIKRTASRPIELVVLNCWVTETNETPLRSNASMMRAKSRSDRLRRSTL